MKKEVSFGFGRLLIRPLNFCFCQLTEKFNEKGNYIQSKIQLSEIETHFNRKSKNGS